MNHLTKIAVFATVLSSQIIVTESLSRVSVLRTRRTELSQRTQSHRIGLPQTCRFPNVLLHSSKTDDESSPAADNDGGMEDEDNYMGSNQYDEYEMAGQPADAEMIEAMRLERVIANDRWQSCLIRDKQGGEWTG